MRRISTLVCTFAVAIITTSALSEQPRHFSNLLTPVTQFGEYGAGNDNLNTPISVALDARKYIYIADHKNHRIQVRAQTGQFLQNIGRQGTGDGELQFPSSVSVTDEKIFVADKGNSRIAVFSKNGDFLHNIQIRSKAQETISPYYMDVNSNRIALIPFDDPRLIVIDAGGTTSESLLPREIEGLPFDPGGLAFVGEQLILTDAALIHPR